MRESLSKTKPVLVQGVPVTGEDSNSSIKSVSLKPGIRNSKLSNQGSNGSKLSLKTPLKSPRTSRQNLQSTNPEFSKCKMIQEEGSENHSMRPLPPRPSRQGWKVLRESIKRKEFQQGLRHSGKVFHFVGTFSFKFSEKSLSELQLHTMDEVAPSRSSSGHVRTSKLP